MEDDHKTRQQLIGELAGLRQRAAELEAAETGRRRAEEGLRRVNRALRMLSECNQAAIRATDEPRLLRDVCRIIVEVGGYRLAWVGLAGHDEGKTVRPVAQAGYEEGYLGTVDITWADTERGRGPTGTAIRTGRPSINQDVLANPDYAPWRDEAIRRGYASSVALPLIAQGQTLGALNIYAVRPDAFDADEVELLTELANDLAHGVMALRTRVERQEATGALRESEERYRLLVETSPFGIGVHQDGKIAFLNTAGARLLGAETPQELIGKPVNEIVHSEGWEAARDRIQRMLAGETVPYPIENRYVRLDGDMVPVEVTAAPLVYNGRPAIQVIVLDITRRRRALEALQESQRALSTLMSNLPGMAYRCRGDRNWTMEFVSEGCVDLTGYQPADLVENRTIAYGDLIHPDDRTMVWETVQSAVQQGRSFGLFYRIRTAGGEERWVWEQGSGVFSPQGELQALEGFITDVTERKRAEDALRRSLEETAHSQHLLLALSQAAQAVQRARTPGEVYRTIGDEIARLRYQVTIFTLTDDRAHLAAAHMTFKPAVVRAAEKLTGLSAQDYRFPLVPGSFYQRVVAGGEPVFSDLGADPIAEALPKLVHPLAGRLARLLGVEKAIYVPLKVGGETHSLLTVMGADLTEADVPAMSTFASQAGIAVENARLYEAARQEIAERKRAEEALQQHSERLRTLHAIDGAILAAWSAEKIAQAALRHLRLSVPYWRASVILLDPDGQEGTLVAVHVDGETKVGAHTRVSLDEIGDRDRFEHGLVQVMEDIVGLAATAQRQGAQLPPWVRSLQAEGLRSYVAAPLIAQGELIGLLNLGMNTPGSFIPEHVDIAREVADQIAVGLHQARLREQVQRHVAELEERVAERTAELSAANVELAHASRLKDEFLASMSHELRTPLNAVLGMSEVLQEQIYGPLNERQLGALRTIDVSGHHLLSLINDILDVSKIEAGKVELDIGPVPVDSLCRASLGLTRQAAREKQLRLSSSLDSAVMTVQGDERRLKQVLVNLLSNAVKFTPQGGEIGLEVVGDAEGEAVRFTVWDTGIGISEDDVVRLFQPFVQLDSSLSREYTGSGLGLVLVHRIAEMHGGGVSVESEPGKGSRFTVSLPWRPGDEGEWGWAGDESEQVIGQEAEPPMPGRQPSATVLLVDDNESTISTISDYLLARGYRVVVARNGIEGVDRATEERPDVILMDVQMPRMDGLEATRRIRADADLRDVPIVALTALAMPGDRERCLAAGANAYLSKPVSLKELAGVIETQVNRDGVVE